MCRHIELIDLDRPDEPLKALVEGLGDTQLMLAIPNTSVRFNVRRRDSASPFKGSLGGRDFIFDPIAWIKARGARGRNHRRR